MVMTDLTGKILLAVTGLGTLLFGLANALNFNLVEQFIPGQATIIYYGFLFVGGFAIWSVVKG